MVVSIKSMIIVYDFRIQKGLITGVSRRVDTRRFGLV